jgi:hypothetical protein
MKKYLLLFSLYVSLVSFSQVTVYDTLSGYRNLSDDSVSYLFKSTNGVSNLSVYDKTNNVSTPLTTFNQPLPGGYYMYNILPDVKNGKFLTCISKFTPGQNQRYNYLAYNGTAIDTLFTGKQLNSMTTNFPILRSTYAFVFFDDKIYKTDYTKNGTVLITSKANSNTSLVENIVELNGKLIWCEKGISTAKSYLRSYDGTTVNNIDSSSNEYSIYLSKATNEIFVSNYYNLYKFNSSLVKTTLLSSPSNTLFLFSLMGKINNDLIISSINGIFKYNLVTSSFSLLKTVSSTTASPRPTYSNLVYYPRKENGSYLYFDSFDSTNVNTSAIWVTNGTWVKQVNIGTDTYFPSNINNGKFCDDYLWLYTNASSLTKVRICSPQGNSVLAKYPNNTDITGSSGNMYSLYKADNAVYFAEFKNNKIKNYYSNNCGSPLLSTAIHENNSEMTFNTFPNPAKDILNIHVSETNFEAYSLIIKDVLGKPILSTRIDTPKSTITISELKGGIYTLTLYKNNTAYSQKLVIE